MRFGTRQLAGIVALLAGLSSAAILADEAAAARIVTWEGKRIGESRFVDPSRAPAGSYNEPPGVAERPNALRANVYLPRGYASHPRRRYPVLFLLHGVGDSYDAWAHRERGHVRKTVRGFDGIIVMPEGDRGFYIDWWNGGLRRDPAWERYYLEQLIPLVRKRLRIRRGRRWHAIAGLSMGGGGALYLAAQRPGFFGSAAAFSAPLSIQRATYQQGFEAASEQEAEAIYGDPDGQEFYWRGHNPAALVANLASTRLFVSHGDGTPGHPDDALNPAAAIVEAEMSQQGGEFARAADRAAVPLTYRPHAGIHGWRYWRSDLAAAIRWDLFARPKRPRGRWQFRTVSQRGRMWRFRYRFAEPPVEVITFRRDGRLLRAEGSGLVVICAPGGRKLTATLPFERRLPFAGPPRSCRR